MIRIYLFELVLLLLVREIIAWQSQSAFYGRGAVFVRHPKTAATTTLMMRDMSASYWFNVGDQVKVVDDVLRAGSNLKGMYGVVVETWSKCEVDPTCCCAEQVDTNMAVRVEFMGTLESTFCHYCSEDELIQVKREEFLAFDGMTCTAFKLEQLQKRQSPRGIASFEPCRAIDDETL
jgi:hypothetical protein